MENQYQSFDDMSDVVGICAVRCGPFGENLLCCCTHRGIDDMGKKDWRARCEAIEADAIEFDDSWCEDMPDDVMDYLHGMYAREDGSKNRCWGDGYVWGKE